jgi:hypothetical protein
MAAAASSARIDDRPVSAFGRSLPAHSKKTRCREEQCSRRELSRTQNGATRDGSQSPLTRARPIVSSSVPNQTEPVDSS